MIERDRPSALRLLFVWLGSLGSLLPQVLGFALYAAMIVAAADALSLDRSRMGEAPFAVVGITLTCANRMVGR